MKELKELQTQQYTVILLEMGDAEVTDTIVSTIVIKEMLGETFRFCSKERPRKHLNWACDGDI